MPVSERAKQFSAFKALGGLDEALERKRQELGYTERRVLSPDDEIRINDILCSLSKGDRVTVEFYNGKFYETKTVVVERVDEYEKKLHTDLFVFLFGNIADVKTEKTVD